MGKKAWATILGASLAASILSPAPGSGAAEKTTPIPAKVQIEDPLNDANFLNDQDNVYGTPAQGEGDHAGPADVGSVSDFLKVWFTNTKTKISVHILTERPPPASSTVYYRVASNPGEGKVAANTDRGCLNWRMIFGGQQANPAGGSIDTSTYRGSDASAGANLVEFEDVCNVAERKPGKAKVETLEDGTGITTMTVPRSYSPLFAKGKKIKLPYALSRIAVGQQGTGLPTGGDFFSAAQADNTKRGSTYKILDPRKRCRPKGSKRCRRRRTEPQPDPEPTPTQGCTAYKPGEQGAEAETTVVKRSATEAAPVELAFDTEPGLGAGLGTVNGVPIPSDALISHVFHNVQVDSKSSTTGLWVRLEIPENTDYDIFLNNPDGTEAAHAAGFNPFVDASDGTGAGGHSEATAEQLDGVKSKDCQGYTLDIWNATGPGGEVTLKLWLGEATYDPAAPPQG